MLWSARTFRSLIKPFRLFTPAFLLPAISSPPILSTRRSCFAQCRTGPLCWQSRISATRPGCAIACLLNPTWGTSLRRWRRSRSTARGGVCFGDCLCSQEHEIPAGIAQRKSAASKGAEVGGSSPSPRATARSSTAELSALNREMLVRVQPRRLCPHSSVGRALRTKRRGRRSEPCWGFSRYSSGLICSSIVSGSAPERI
jgi:hypothetical protein